jgi:acyl-CoA synthetase (AMP-forming)/AMP-acid ligase II
VACHQQLRYSYRELRDEADRAARALIALGVQRGDRVGIWSGNCAEWMITQYAAAKAGALLVNVNPAYRLRELEYALTHSGVSVLIAARTFRSSDYVQLLLELMPELRTGNPAGSRGQTFWITAIVSQHMSSRRAKRPCSSTIRSVFSTPRERRAPQKARRSRTTTF